MGWSSFTKAISKAVNQVGDVISTAYDQAEEFVSDTAKNIETLGKNSLSNPLGTAGLITLGGLTAGYGLYAAGAMLTSKKGTEALVDLENHDATKVLGAAGLAATAVAGASAYMAAPEVVPLAEMAAPEVVPLSTTGSIGYSTPIAEGVSTGATSTSALSSTTKVVGALLLGDIAYSEYQAYETEKEAKKAEEEAAALEAQWTQDNNDAFKAAIDADYALYQSQQASTQYNYTTQAGAFGNYQQGTSFGSFNPVTGVFSMKKTYV